MCSDIHAQESRDKHLYKALKELEDSSTNVNILHIFEVQLCKVLNVPNRQKYHSTKKQQTKLNKTLSNALHNQNIIGWHEFLRGFISKYWIKAQDITQIILNKKHTPWKLKIAQTILALHKNIWEDRNTFVHGKTIDEARKKAREAISNRIKEVYENPPKLAS